MNSIFFPRNSYFCLCLYFKLASASSKYMSCSVENKILHKNYRLTVFNGSSFIYNFLNGFLPPSLTFTVCISIRSGRMKCDQVVLNSIVTNYILSFNVSFNLDIIFYFRTKGLSLLNDILVYKKLYVAQAICEAICLVKCHFCVLFWLLLLHSLR